MNTQKNNYELTHMLCKHMKDCVDSAVVKTFHLHTAVFGLFVILRNYKHIEDLLSQQNR